MVPVNAELTTVCTPVREPSLYFLSLLVCRFLPWCLSQLNLAGNELCGLNYRGEGTYTVEGITAIAGALRVNASLTNLS